MLETMASQWQRILKGTENLVFNEAPRLIRHLQNPENVPRTLQQGLKLGLDVGLSVPAFFDPAQPAASTTADKIMTAPAGFTPRMGES